MLYKLDGVIYNHAYKIEGKGQVSFELVSSHVFDLLSTDTSNIISTLMYKKTAKVIRRVWSL